MAEPVIGPIVGPVAGPVAERVLLRRISARDAPDLSEKDPLASPTPMRRGFYGTALRGVRPSPDGALAFCAGQEHDRVDGHAARRRAASASSVDRSGPAVETASASPAWIRHRPLMMVPQCTPDRRSDDKPQHEEEDRRKDQIDQHGDRKAEVHH